MDSSYEHTFAARGIVGAVTSQGSPYSRFRRALSTNNALLAWAACSELPRVELHDALALVLLLGRAHDANFHRACSRWVARYSQQVGCDSAETELVRASLVAVASGDAAQPAARRALLELVQLHGLSECATALQTVA